MSSQPAMGTVGNGIWEPLSDLKLDEWFLLKDELSNSEVNDPSSKLTKYEIAEQVLHDIEDLGKNNADYWLDELPLFDEIHTPLKSGEEPKSKFGLEFENFDFLLDQEAPSSLKNGSAVPDAHKQLSDQQDLFSLSYEDAATFILSNKNIVCINEPFLSFTSVQQGFDTPFECKEKGEEKIPAEDPVNKENVNFDVGPSWDGDSVAGDKKEMAVVEEILKSTALELDQWESDTSRSEISSDGMISGDSSPKAGGGEEEETDDPDWKPSSGTDHTEWKYARRSKPYWRGGNEEEKKLRKKEQNKNAATRYRQKKKAEVCEILKEEKLLREKKAKLEERLADIQSEIKYLKPLMRELFRAKGIIK